VTALWKGGDPSDPECFNLVTDGIEAFVIRGRHSYRPIGGAMPAGAYVGGEIQIAEVTSQGVTSATIHRWPVNIGQVISFI
jgi:hypothetical protein